MKILELKLQPNMSSEEEKIIFSSHKNINRLLITNDGSGFKIFHNNTFLPLCDGDYLRLENTLIAISITEQSMVTDLVNSIKPPSVVRAVSAEHVEYEDVNFLMAAPDSQYSRFDVDTLLKGQLVANDPLSFLFQKNILTALSGSEQPIQNYNQQPLPLLKQHFNTQREAVVSDSTAYPLISQTTAFDEEKRQGNILYDLGLSDEPEWNAHRAIS